MVRIDGPCQMADSRLVSLDFSSWITRPERRLHQFSLGTSVMGLILFIVIHVCLDLERPRSVHSVGTEIIGFSMQHFGPLEKNLFPLSLFFSLPLNPILYLRDLLGEIRGALYRNVRNDLNVTIVYSLISPGMRRRVIISTWWRSQCELQSPLRSKTTSSATSIQFLDCIHLIPGLMKDIIHCFC